MAIELRNSGGVYVATLAGELDEESGQELVSKVAQEVAKGGKLILDGHAVTKLDQDGLVHLLSLQRRMTTPEHKKLLVTGFSPAVWNPVVELGVDFMFEAKPTLAEAAAALGATIAAPPAPKAAAAPPVPPPPAAPAAAEAVPAQVSPTPSSAPARREAEEPSVWAQPPPGGSDYPTRVERAPDDHERPPARPPQQSPSGWEKPPGKPLRSNSPPLPPPPVGRPVKKGISRGVICASAGAVALLVVIGLAWSLLGHRAPELKISAAEVTAEEGGKEVDEVVVEVKRGKLVETSWSSTLPEGLFFDNAGNESVDNTYSLRGVAARGSRDATVSLVAASSSGQKTEPVSLTVHIKPKPQTWQLNTLQTLDLRAGEEIRRGGKFLLGASAAPTAKGLPSGVRVENAPNSPHDWQLAGRPESAGSFTVTFTAGGGDRKEITLKVEPAASKVAEGGASPGKEVAVHPDDNALKGTNEVAKLDDRFRSFLLQRIESLPARYTTEDRDHLREVVQGLKEARTVAHVLFEHDGQMILSEAESAKLRASLQSPEIQRLLKSPNCQVAIVGYASKTGSMAANVRISKARAKAVDNFLRSVVGRNADLCGDYGPTDVVDATDEANNRAVEIYAGILEPTGQLAASAAGFKQDFNRRHGVR